MGKIKHRRLKSSPEFINGWRRSDSFDSVIEETPKRDDDDHGNDGLPHWHGIRINENLEKKPESELESMTDIINIHHVINTKSKSLQELPQLSVFFNGNERDDYDYPIFKPSSPSNNNFSSSSLPPNYFSHSSSDSSISLRPSSNVSSASLSSIKKTSNPFEDIDHKNSISSENSGGLESSFELTFPVSDFGQSQGSFMGRMISLIQSPPPIQAMERSGEAYDPHRIPSAIFETARTVEWSATSNESLFSLNLGRTNSLSPEKLFSLGDFKSGEQDPLAVYRFGAARASDSDSNCYRTSDVEIDLLKKIVEDEVPNLEEKVTENADLERIIEVHNEVEDETNNKIQLNLTRADSKQVTETALAPSFRVEDLTEKNSSDKINEESVKSTSSFAFQVLEDRTKPKDRRRSSIEIRQNLPYFEPPSKPKAKSKSWFNWLRWCCCCGGGCSCFSVICSKPCCSGCSCTPSCCSGASCSPPPCNCCTCRMPSCTCKCCCSSCSWPSCTCSWCRCFCCGGCSFCCFGSCCRFFSCRRFLCC